MNPVKMQAVELQRKDFGASWDESRVGAPAVAVGIYPVPGVVS